MSKLRIYTDGSHLKHTTGRLGIGGVLVDENDKELQRFSTEISLEYLKVAYDTSDVSNPTCEMLAVLWALLEFKKQIKPQDTVTVKADYVGVREWNTGKWKITKPYIQRIKDDISQEINKQNLRGRIDFEWVKGHQTDNSSDTKWNNVVDKLSKGEKV